MKINNDNSLRFTLIELLIVIGIIGILASMLLPALSMARNTAKSISCNSQLKQFGTAVIAYENDYNGYIPEPFINSYSGTVDKKSWYSYIMLGQYLGRKEDDSEKLNILFCPSTTIINYPKRTSYAMNYINHTSAVKWEKLSSINQPSKNIIVVDSTFHNGDRTSYHDATISYADFAIRISGRHTGMTNAVYLDGHTFSRKATTYNTTDFH